MSETKGTEGTEAGRGMVSSATLCELSGLTDRRHRQLAAEGFFPPPVRGQYPLRATIAGLFRYYRELQQKRGATLAQKREKKLDNENILLELEIAKEEGQLISVEEMVSRLTPACAAMRTRILGCGLADAERDALLDDLGRLLEGALMSSELTKGTKGTEDDGDTGSIRASGEKAQGNPAAAAASVRKPVG